MTPDVHDVEMPYPQYRCPNCEKDLPLSEARVTVTCGSHVTPGARLEFEVREAVAADRRAIEEICEQAWGETDVDTLGATFDVMSSTNLVAIDGKGGLLGLVSTASHRGEAVIVLLSVYPESQGHGVGTALVEAAVLHAEERGLPFMVVGVSNDDIPSLYFYQRLGFVIYDIARGALSDRSGSVDPGFAGIPIRDEIRLRRPLGPRR